MSIRSTQQIEPLPEGKPLQRIQINNILCPVDFSIFSENALRYAIRLARHFGSRLFIQHTTQSSPRQVDVADEKIGTGTRGKQPANLESVRDQIRRMLTAGGIDTSETVVLLNTGAVAERILETISAEKIDLLVMGTHGHKGFNHLVLGSVTETIIHQAVCPVLAVSRPSRNSGVDQGEPFKTILLATDFSTHSDRALAYALKWACEWRARIVLFHVVEEPAPAMRGMVDLFPEYNPYFDRQLAGAWDLIRNQVPEAAQPWCDATYDVRHGNPKQEILRVAEQTGADLIVTGARGTGSSSTQWGSVSSAVVREGRFPVLVVRELRIETTPRESAAQDASAARWLPIGDRRGGR
jgi:nucleotide-binding universal stress UspA family protein